MGTEYIGRDKTNGVVVGQSGGKVALFGETPVAQQAATTAALTTITPADAAGTPDYAIAAVTNSTAYGFASAQEAITVLYVIKNLQTRVAELETALENVGIIAT